MNKNAPYVIEVRNNNMSFVFARETNKRRAQDLVRKMNDISFRVAQGIPLDADVFLSEVRKIHIMSSFGEWVK